MDTDTDDDPSDQPQFACPVEGDVSDHDQELDQALSEEHIYQETMSGIRSYMGWSHIPNIDTTTSTAGAKLQPVGKISVDMPTDKWLCS